MWIRDGLTSQVLPEFQTHKSLSEISMVFSTALDLWKSTLGYYVMGSAGCPWAGLCRKVLHRTSGGVRTGPQTAVGVSLHAASDNQSPTRGRGLLREIAYLML